MTNHVFCSGPDKARFRWFAADLTCIRLYWSSSLVHPEWYRTLNIFEWCSLTQVMTIRLGKSGLKMSRIILGIMSYGDPSW
ncbi:hypothetical protein BJY52DRAFT_1124718 [Lactarius psammicola]|nr:hypothetical protein BJY52DRAFT_1124718 [Lactarius psammicola]